MLRRLFLLAGLMTAAGVAAPSYAASNLNPCDDVIAGPYKTTLTLTHTNGRNTSYSTYSIEYLGNQGNTFTYKVKEVSGKDLSHWNLILPECFEYVTGGAGPGSFSKGQDGSTGTTGLKWDVSDNFSSGTFSFTINSHWVLGTIQVLAKASNTWEIGDIAGPVCCEPSTMVPTPAAAGMGLAMLGALGMRRRTRRDAQN